MVAPIGSSSVTPVVPVFKPSKVEKLDQVGGLFQTSLPDSTDDSSVAFVYSKGAVAANAALPKAAIFLKNADGSYFSVDLNRDSQKNLTDKVSMVASSSNIDLYIYNPDATGSAEKYSFDATGKMTGDGPTTLNAMDVSAAEISTKRDLDGNGGLGASLKKTGDNNGMLDATGGMYQVNVLGQNVLVVGNALEKAKTIDVSTSALRNTDGSAWAPDTQFASFRAVSTTTGTGADKTTSWTVYGTTAIDQNGAGGDVHKFSFKASDDKKGFTLDGEDVTLNASQLATAEKTTKRDLNNDGKFGVTVQTDAVDAKGGLYSGNILGQDFYLIGTGLKTATKADAAQDLSGSLLNGEGAAWVKPEGYTISALVKNKGADEPAYSMYAYKSANGSAPADKNDVLRFDFAAADGNYKVTDASADGVAMNATDLAKAEKAMTRDLNADTVFGVNIEPGAVDATGGLYNATALGNSFLVVGKSLVSSAAKPMDLSSALLTSDGEAWKPDDVANIGTNKLKIVTEVGQDKAVTGYSVYVKEDAGSFAKYSFGADFKQTGERTELTQEDLATAEKTNNRDLSGDGKFGVVLTGSPDVKGGLYQGNFETQGNVFIRSDAKLALGGLVASKAVDMTNALKTEEGYWDVEAGYNIKAAYTEGTGDAKTYNVIAANANDVSDVRKYTFNTSTNMLDAEHSGDMSLIDLAAAEKTQKRDLNGDGIVAVKVSATLDKTGGLFQVETAGKHFLAISSTAVKDLSTAILDSDGKAWAVPGDNASVVLKKQDDNSYKIYTKSTGDTPTYNEYAVSADFKYVEDSAKTLSLTDLADAEKASGRDINGDRSIGASVTKVIDKAAGLYEATIDHQKMVLFSASNPGKSTALGDKVLLSSDETTPWAAGAEYTLRSVVKSDIGDKNIELYATKTVDGKDVTSRFTFTENRVLSEQEDLTADQLATAEKTLGRDLNADKAVGLAVSGIEDKVGGLYKASVMGQDFYVLGAKGLKTGTTGATAIDLSKALLDTEGNAWKLDEGFKVGGVITNKNDAGEVTSYDLYTYKGSGADVTDVKKTSWDANMSYRDSVAADPVALVDVEAKNARDLSGDGTVGFRKVATDDAQYLGVTSARVVGSDLKFWLAGSDLKAGSPSKPLTIKDALLNEDGTAPWQIDEGFKVKAVLDGTGDASGSRYVYAANTDNTAVLKYTFSKVDGKSAGAGETVNSIDLAKLETDLKKDLNGDQKTGVATVTDWKDGGGDGSTGRSTGLLKASLLGQDFLVVNKMPSGTKNINLTAALLNADGSAWAKPDGFTVKGVYQPDADNTEVYGTDADGKLDRYKFTATKVDDVATGSWTVKDATDEDPLLISGTTLAKSEASAKKDLNGDGAIGFKVGDGIASQSNGWSVGKAGVGTPPVDAPDTDQVYIVGKNLTKMGTVATNLANSAALQYTGDDGKLAYWKPEAGYVVKSIQQPDATPGTVNLFASKLDADSGNTSYMKYVFTQDADKNWTLDSANTSAAPLSSKDFVQTEVDAKRDLNGDGAVGLKVSSDSVTPGLLKATIDNQQFLLVGKSLTSGTSSKPLGFNALLQRSDGTAWTPDDGVTATSWTALVAPLADGVPADSKFALAKSDSSTSYFGADYKEISA